MPGKRRNELGSQSVAEVQWRKMKRLDYLLCNTRWITVVFGRLDSWSPAWLTAPSEIRLTSEPVSTNPRKSTDPQRRMITIRGLINGGGVKYPSACARRSFPSMAANTATDALSRSRKSNGSSTAATSTALTGGQLAGAWVGFPVVANPGPHALEGL